MDYFDWYDLAAVEAVWPGTLTGSVIVVCSNCGATVEISAEDYERGIRLCGCCKDN
jgi:hypothetical protein